MAIITAYGAVEAVVRTNPVTHPPRASRLREGEVLEPFVTSRVATFAADATLVAVGEHGIYVAGEKLGVVAVPGTGSPDPAARGRIGLPGTPVGLLAYGDNVYASCAWNGTVVANAADPSLLRLTSTLPSGSSARASAGAGSYLFVADWASGMQVLSLKNPQQPQVLGFFDTPGHAYDVTVVGDRAYLADFDGGVHIFDVSSPARPRTSGTWRTMPAPAGIASAENRVFVADEQRGLFIVDVSKPDAPEILSEVRTDVGARDVVVSGDRALVSDLAGGVSLFDVSDPTSPQPLGRTQVANFPVGMAVSGRTVYLAAGDLVKVELGQ